MHVLVICHWFISDGEALPQVDVDHLNPPLKMLEIVSHWVETYPTFLFPAQLLDQHATPKLPLLNSNSNHQSLDFYSSHSPLIGLIQWCVISPLTTGLNLYGQKSRKGDSKSPSLKSPGIITDPFSNPPTELSSKSSSEPKDATTMMADLHANLLSLLLSGTYQLPIQLVGKHGHLLTGSDMRGVVSLLLGFKEKLASSSENSRTVMSSLESWLDESIERLAQFLQILLSTGLLSVKQGIECRTCTNCICLIWRHFRLLAAIELLPRCRLNHEINSSCGVHSSKYGIVVIHVIRVKCVVHVHVCKVSRLL